MHAAGVELNPELVTLAARRHCHCACNCKKMRMTAHVMRAPVSINRLFYRDGVLVKSFFENDARTTTKTHLRAHNVRRASIRSAAAFLAKRHASLHGPSDILPMHPVPCWAPCRHQPTPNMQVSLRVRCALSASSRCSPVVPPCVLTRPHIHALIHARRSTMIVASSCFHDHDKNFSGGINDEDSSFRSTSFYIRYREVTQSPNDAARWHKSTRDMTCSTARTHARTHAPTHPHIHTRTHTHSVLKFQTRNPTPPPGNAHDFRGGHLPPGAACPLGLQL
jgi:hypothetical protein